MLYLQILITIFTYLLNIFYVHVFFNYNETKKETPYQKIIFYLKILTFRVRDFGLQVEIFKLGFDATCQTLNNPVIFFFGHKQSCYLYYGI